MQAVGFHITVGSLLQLVITGEEQSVGTGIHRSQTIIIILLLLDDKKKTPKRTHTYTCTHTCMRSLYKGKVPLLLSAFFKEAILCSFLGVHILFSVTTRADLYALPGLASVPEPGPDLQRLHDEFPKRSERTAEEAAANFHSVCAQLNSEQHTCTHTCYT